MHCDQAFDIMTSSERESSLALDEHLGECPRCRDMRATIEPALELFQPTEEPIPCEPWASASPQASEIATQVARRLIVAAPRPRTLQHWAGYTAAAALGAVVACGLLTYGPSPRDPSGPHAGTVCSYLDRGSSSGITSRQMTQSCLACHSVPAAH